MMNDAYRDELEATLARASELEREIEELRRTNAELESFEARHNARRLVAAIDREREEKQRNDDRDREDARLRLAAKEAARMQADAEERLHLRNSLSILAAGLIAALVAGMTSSLAIGVGSFALFAIGLIYLYVAESQARKRRQKGDGT
jgi:Flp pilus assembly protein TadB